VGRRVGLTAPRAAQNLTITGLSIILVFLGRGAAAMISRWRVSGCSEGAGERGRE
jgi:hypothetical protein